MQKISLKDWVVLLTILPTSIIGLCLAGYFSYSRYAEMNEFLDLRAKSIIQPLAIASRLPLEKRNRDELSKLINVVHRSHSLMIKTIAVFTLDNQLYVNSAYHGDTNILRINAGDEISDLTSKEDLGNQLIYRTPIINERNFPLDINANYRQNNIGYIAIQIDKDKVLLKQQNQIIVAFVIVFIGIAISFIFTIKLIRSVTRPVSSMVKAIDRIREGKLESRVTGQLIGELNFLKSGINGMAQSLGDYQDEMQRAIDQATLDLRESLEQFEIQNVELDIAKRKAQDANRVKSEFLANMSHELRTPLNGVIGFTRQVLKTPLTATQRDYLQTIERSANNLLAIINDILDFSKLDAGRLVIENIPFPLRESMEETLTLLSQTAHNKNLELSMNIAQDIPDSLIGDAMRVKQILINLAGNAIKFTDKGTITIDVECVDTDANSATIKVSVSDTGIGIAHAQQETLFEAFGQADKSITRLYGGTGLGLVISKRLTAEMNGNIGFSSTENKGSTFWFTFQCQLNPIPLSTPLNTDNLINKSVYYYEPHQHSRSATIATLESWSMRVTTIQSLSELTPLQLESTDADFLLMAYDVNSGEINELRKLLSLIKPYIASIHVVVNSNSPNIHDAMIAAGASSCISKPLTPQKLSRAFSPNIQNNAVQQNNQMDYSEQRLAIKVLAVDDNEANLKLISALLLEQVTDVIVAQNGEEALNLCNQEQFALIFMDIQMPVMDGVTACKYIKQQTKNSDTPIIAVTAHALSGEKEKLLDEGFDSYMTKPIDETMLRHIIFEHCEPSLLTTELDKTSPLIREIKTSKVIIDWDLALKRAGNKPDLARDMLHMLVKSLPEAKQQIMDALDTQDAEQVQSHVHKLNGACCYNGVPNLEKIGQQIETSLKKNQRLTDLEPEFFEFFDEIDKLLLAANDYLNERIT